MDNIKLFKNPSFGSIRTIEKDNKIWFVAKDIADALGYHDTYNMVRRLDIDDVSKLDAGSENGSRQKSFHLFVNMVFILRLI